MNHMNYRNIWIMWIVQVSICRLNNIRGINICLLSAVAKTKVCSRLKLNVLAIYCSIDKRAIINSLLGVQVLIKKNPAHVKCVTHFMSGVTSFEGLYRKSIDRSIDSFKVYMLVLLKIQNLLDTKC